MATTTWIITADSSRARVLQVADREHKFVEVEDFVNPEARLQDRDLQTDSEPRFNGRTGGPGSDRETKGAVEHSVEVFAREIGQYLEKARNQHRFDRLHLVAPPKFLGALRKELGKEVEKLVAQEVPKDLSSFNTRELERYLDAKA